MVAALICAVVQMRVSKLLGNAAENVSGLQSRPNIDFLVVGTIYRVDVLRQLLADLDGARCIVDDGFQKQPFVPLSPFLMNTPLFFQPLKSESWVASAFWAVIRTALPTE